MSVIIDKDILCNIITELEAVNISLFRHFQDIDFVWDEDLIMKQHWLTSAIDQLKSHID